MYVPRLTANSEVESILHIPLASFLNTMSEDNIPEHRSIQEMYTFTFEKYNIWGASARMLKQINTITLQEKLAFKNLVLSQFSLKRAYHA